jgi:hypothetical protein
MAESEDDFLSRWSRRKADARGGGLQKKQPESRHKPGRMRTEPLVPEEEPVTAGTPGNEAAEPVEEAALKEEQPLVPADESASTEEEQGADQSAFEDFDFDSLNYKSDYTQFMKKGVPEVVRRRALRMLWQSNPILANLDGLNDYDEDFTDAAMVMKTFTSNYKVGSGYMTEEERLASYSEEARKAGSDAPDEATGDVDVEDLDVEDIDDDAESPDDVRSASAEAEKPEKDEPA